MSAPTHIDPGLLDFASPAQRRYCEAIELHGSARAAVAIFGPVLWWLLQDKIAVALK